jgi:hypothetical protein
MKEVPKLFHEFCQQKREREDEQNHNWAIPQISFDSLSIKRK